MIEKSGICYALHTADRLVVVKRQPSRGTADARDPNHWANKASKISNRKFPRNPPAGTAEIGKRRMEMPILSGSVIPRSEVRRFFRRVGGSNRPTIASPRAIWVPEPLTNLGKKDAA